MGRKRLIDKQGVSPEEVKSFYKKGVYGRGLLKTSRKFNISYTAVRGIVDPKYIKRINKISMDRYWRLKEKGICHTCGQKKKI